MNDFYTIDHLPGRTIRLDGEEYLFFSGTSYLGLAQNKDFQQLLAEGLGRYGTVFGSSRNGNLRLGIYEEAEAKLAAFAGAEAALTLSSGMMAGQMVMAWLKSEGYHFVYGPSAHPAIWHEPSVALPSLPFETWAAQLPDRLRTVTSNRIAIVVNSLDAVQSVRYSFDWVADLPGDLPITLLIDDSHGLGVIGEGGRGILGQVPRRPNIRTIVTASLAKAMGLPGGVLFAESTILSAIRRMAFFGACSPTPPAYLYAYSRAEAIYQTSFQQLQQNISHIEELLTGSPLFQHSKGYPVFYTPYDGIYAQLVQNKVLIYSFAYPSPTDKPNTRIVINALHTADDLERLATLLVSGKK
ncbi:aminotransferase class I/II-fold pyridoxal phosphate-dependent enzyme [Tellurirhabdus bombi]|uniref:aminotransferase class I/II-fold pyridoxal phosphate-dependent enzyme n=1 Tax=Tellurirhabdus bombi TaxID=2907205 RepID=UPI001F4440A5|nr:aminotransferase class I/II-fold pyridoxal phosphate-dependent enzyme [Tellurirhabdus bombi]